MLFADIDFRLSEMSEEEEEDLRTALLSFFPEEPVVVDDAEYASFVIEFEITEGEESSIERCVFYEKEGEWYLLGMYTAEPLA